MKDGADARLKNSKFKKSLCSLLFHLCSFKRSEGLFISHFSPGEGIFRSKIINFVPKCARVGIMHA